MSNSNSSGGEVITVLIGAVLVLAAVIVGLALFISVGVLYGSGVGFVNYWRALINNVAMERPQL